MKKHFSNYFVVLLFFVSTLTVLAISVYTSFMMNSTSEFLKSNIEARLLAISHSAAQLVTADELGQLVAPEDMEKPLFEEIKNRMIAFAKDADILFVYYLRDVENDEMQFIIDNDTSEETVNLSTPAIPSEPGPRAAMDGTTTTAGLGNYSVGYDGILSAFSPVFDKEGNVVAIAGVDITDEQVLLMRGRINTLTVMLLISMTVVIASGYLGFSLYRKKALQSETANIAKSMFLANMSHELYTPMNAIIGMTTIATSSPAAEQKDHCLEKIAEASKHLRGVINDILDMSKIEANKFDLSSAPFHFEKMLQKVAGVINFRVDEKRQNFKVSIGKDIPSMLSGDDQRLAQIITNLLSNAVKFTPEGGSIRLEAALVKEENGVCTIRVEVADTGIGISEEQKTHLFTSFSQADSSISRKFGGTGLGLVISKRIIEMMGGEIWVDSTPGNGSTFSFTLKAERVEEPLGPTEHSNPKADAGEQTKQPNNFKGNCLLLAEDVEINREIVLTLLEPTMIEVDCAENGAKAVELFTASPDKYDMIFMDLQMPEMDGYEATRRIRESGIPEAKRIPIIAMTANVFREDIERCLASGMNDHVGKPLDFDEVISKLRKYISK